MSSSNTNEIDDFLSLLDFSFDDSIDFINHIVKNSTINQLFIPQDYHIENVAQDVVDYTLNIK